MLGHLQWQQLVHLDGGRKLTSMVGTNIDSWSPMGSSSPVALREEDDHDVPLSVHSPQERTVTLFIGEQARYTQRYHQEAFLLLFMVQ